MSDAHNLPKDDLTSKVGRRIRDLRTERGISLRSLAEKSGLNVNTISRIENGKISPSLNSIQQIAEAFNLPVNTFFHFMPPTQSVVFQKSRDRQEMVHDYGTFANLVPGFVNNKLDLILERINPHVNSGKETIIEKGIEFNYCQAGCFYYEIDGKSYLLEEGDSLIFDRRLPHRWSNPGEAPTRLLTMFLPSEEESGIPESHNNPRRDSISS